MQQSLRRRKLITTKMEKDQLLTTATKHSGRPADLASSADQIHRTDSHRQQQRSLRAEAVRFSMLIPNSLRISSSTVFPRSPPHCVSPPSDHTQHQPELIPSSCPIRQVTQHVPESSAQSILTKQRQNRPVSPHLGIYRPQITWYGSILNRITGLALSGPLYLFGAAYLVAPAVGWHLESASIAAAFAAWPVALKVATKMLVAWPFAFHSLNGIRHLVWDLGLQLSNKQVARTGWSVVGLSVLGALALAFV